MLLDTAGTYTGVVVAQQVNRWQRVRAWLREFWCGLRGHDALMHLEKGRMSMRCTSCGYESSGWELNESRPVRTHHGDDRHIMSQVIRRGL